MTAEPKLRKGTKLDYVWYGSPSDAGAKLGYPPGADEVIDIEIIEETGPHCMLPWALITYKNGKQSLINLQQADEVGLIERQVNDKQT